MIYLSRCLFVSRMGSARTGHMVVLYTKEQKMVLSVKDKFEQDDWYLSIMRVMEQEQEQKKKAEQEKVLEAEEKVEVEEEVEEDEGYWTLPPAAFFREVKPNFSCHFSQIDLFSPYSHIGKGSPEMEILNDEIKTDCSVDTM